MSEFTLPLQALKGRGAATRNAHRFEASARSAFDDGWQTWDAALQAPGAAAPTEVRWEEARSALVRNDSPDIAFELSVNPYRGCEHGCSYIEGEKKPNLAVLDSQKEIGKEPKQSRRPESDSA